jgi:membrane dipeptidase
VKPSTLAFALAAALSFSASAQTPSAAQKLAQDAVIVDTHIDAPGVLRDHWADLGNAADKFEFDYTKARAGGLDVAFMSIYTSAKQDEV